MPKFIFLLCLVRMFVITTYTIQQNNRITLVDAYFEPKNIHIVDISKDESKLQCVVYSRGTILSYSSGSDEEKLALYSILHSYLLHQKYPVLFTMNVERLLKFVQVNTRKLNTLYYRSGKQIYKVKLKFERQHVFIRVGGQFEGCVEIFIYLDGRVPYLAQIYSEPECGYTAFLEQGDSVHMVKSALQLCQMLFRVSVFKLKDKSNIECAKEDKEDRMKRAPPRKLKKPLSLAHLSIVNASATWYERHFQAYLEKPEDRVNYKQGLENLNGMISMPYDTFADKAMLTHVQYDELRPYYEGSETWMEFFKAVPKDRQCDMFPWLPRFMDDLMKFEVNTADWCIHLGDLFGGDIGDDGHDGFGGGGGDNGHSEVTNDHPIMIRSDLEVLFEEPLQQSKQRQRGGTRRRRSKKRTRKQRVIVARMSNSGDVQTVL